MRVSLGLSLLAVVASVFVADGLLSALFPKMDRQSRDGESYEFPDAALPTSSGYINVSTTSRARMFYTFYEAIEQHSPLPTVPLILWLQGGPGCSGMTGNFYELGPWRTDADLLLHKNEAPWNQRIGVIFVDSPVGAGFSIAEDEDDIPSDQEQVAAHLFVFLQSFFDLNPSFRTRPFFIAGESYGGKYVPSLGHYIMRKNGILGEPKRGSVSEVGTISRPLRLDGLLVGNGLTHPIVQVQTHGETAYNFGLIDKDQKAYVDKLAMDVVKLVEMEDWYGSYLGRTDIMDWILKVSGIATVLDVRRNVSYHCGPDGTEFLSQFLNRQAVKEALKADAKVQWVPCNPRVRNRLNNDTMKSVKWMVEDLLPIIPILLYQGQFDAKDGVACSEEWMRTLKWEGKDLFFASDRRIWRVGNAVAGYWRSHGTLTHVVVLGAGHEVPADQNVHSQDMVEKWIERNLKPDVEVATL